MIRTHTIVAIATAPGTGGVAILRLSGGGAFDVCDKVFAAACGVAARERTPRMLVMGTLRTDAFDERCMAVTFPAPHSYTGEDVAELHIHGGVALCREALGLCVEAGAVVAQPGEFTKRAFLNGKMDLSAAEGVAALINAQSRAALSAAGRLVGGALRAKAEGWQQDVTRMLAQVEAALDFPEVEGEADTLARVHAHMDALRRALLTFTAGYGAGRPVKEGVHVVLVGRPNVGKSSLLNALLGEDRAIVAATPGTTRDTLSEGYLYRGYLFIVTDTAGLREKRRGAHAGIEAQGMARAVAAARAADAVVLVTDPDGGAGAVLDALQGACDGIPVVTAYNKCDLKPVPATKADLRLSARTGEGVEALKEYLYTLALADKLPPADLVLIEKRHMQALGEAADALAGRADLLPLVAEDLRAAWAALGRITGQTVTERVIDEVFSTFCLGK
ncbi:MAG: tRNA uridine-5-carboxymethylaminomethyl(34) synthesis GTPase MnmE [Clostridiales bacterium]|jgi:tRNA modification GTPase|nr:tRNA uridine-5-carboxymethylaminomethyl(34) synthesis GTPase MnmE [Clostridiales bacterium]